MSQRDERTYLFDMLDCARAIQQFLRDRSFDALYAERMSRSALLREIEVIGEAATHIELETRAKMPDIKWSGLVGMRNTLIHGYMSVDEALVRRAIEIEIPLLIRTIEVYLAD